MKPRKAKRGKSQAAKMVEAAINSLELGDVPDGNMVIVLASCAADGSTAMTDWPHYLDHGKRARALLEIGFKCLCVHPDEKS